MLIPPEYTKRLYTLRMEELVERTSGRLTDLLNRGARMRQEERDALESRYLGKKKAFTLCCLLAYNEKYHIGPNNVDYPTKLAKDRIIEESALRMREITREENFFAICYPALYAVLTHEKCNLTPFQKINAVARWLRSFRYGRRQYIAQLLDEVLPKTTALHSIPQRISAACAYSINSGVFRLGLKRTMSEK